ncbi:MAG TPA: hypothetical protein VE287_13270, partial [Actinopolymorphaceae bacterium]|nr:hypothetical protein [Actinopolymorphaceae bacterium]
MGNLGGVVAVVLILGVVAVFAYLHLQAAEQRTKALQALAAQRGWQWIDEDETYVRDWGGEPFGRGRSRRARNILIGRHGDREIVSFDYEFKTTEGSGDSQRTRTHRFAVWLMTLPSPLPALEVRPEGVFGGRVAAALGMGDLELESEEFNRAFRVSVDDDRYGSAMMHPRMMEYLLASRQAQAVSWRIED